MPTPSPTRDDRIELRASREEKRVLAAAAAYERLDLTIDRRACDLNKIKSIPGLLGKAVRNVKDFDGVKLTCEDESWLMFRPSGTEPLVRIYAEAKSLKKAKDLIAFGRKFLESSS